MSLWAADGGHCDYVVPRRLPEGPPPPHPEIAHTKVSASSVIKSLDFPESFAQLLRKRRLKAKGKSSNTRTAGDPDVWKGRRDVCRLAWALELSASVTVDVAAPVAMEEGVKVVVTPPGNPLADKVTG